VNAGGCSARLFVRRVEQLGYKPGWTFEPKVFTNGRIVVDVAVDQECVYTGRRMVGTARWSPGDLDSLVPLDAFKEWALGEILRMESHEAREWIKLDGFRLFTLHPEGIPG
jgi:hypothetical protein